MHEVAASGARTINRGSRFARGLGGLFVPYGPRIIDLASGYVSTPSGTRMMQSTQSGLGLRYVRSGSGRDTWPLISTGASNSWPYMPAAMGSCSVFLYASFPSLASAGVHGFGGGTNGGGFVGCNFRPSSANAMRWIVNTSAGANIITGSTIATNTPLSYLGTWDGTTSTLYEQGQVKSTSAIGGTITMGTGLTDFSIAGDGTNFCDMIFLVGAVWPNVCLTARDAVELLHRPFSSFLAPHPRRFWFNSTGTTFNQSVNTNTTPAPSMSRQTGKVQPTNTTPVSSIVKQTGKIQSTTTTPAGSIVKQTGKVQSTTTTPLAAIAKAMGKLLGTNTTPAPAISRQTGKIQSTTTTPAPSMLHQESVPQTLSVDTTPVPSITTVFTPAGTATLPPHRGILLGGKLTHRNQ